MGTQSVDAAAYCRDIETYLCRKNDGHLIRVVGPSFDLVAGWARRGVPLKVAFRGIDRYFERYYRKGPRRRPVKIDFCDADVLDVFDEWRRAIGLTDIARAFQASETDGRSAESLAQPGEQAESLALRTGRASLPAHLERVVARLTQARASGALGAAADETVDRVARELDAARAEAHGVRGDARRRMLEHLAAIDAELMAMARASIDEPTRAALAKEVDADLASYRESMASDQYGRAREAALDDLIRQRLALPTVRFG